MATNSPIEWTDATWNPVTGCDKISPGCKHCYAERMAKRLKAARNPNYRNGFDLTLQPQMLTRPLGVEKAEEHLRQLDERSVPRRRAARIHPTGFRRDERG